MHTDVSIAISYLSIYSTLEGISMKTNETCQCNTPQRDIIKYDTYYDIFVNCNWVANGWQ